MAKFNGHKNWNHWNVSLWLHNDEVLYHLMVKSIDYSVDRDDAIAGLLERLSSVGITHTPDGALYSKSAIRSAMVGL
jgi:hypothetical protein